MSFPTSPINGQETTINGITYIFSSSNNAWTRKPRQLFTAGVNAPANPAAGDQWYDTSDDILYQYLNDGTNSYWVDIRSGIFGGNAATLGETLIQGNLIPVANVVYSLGNTTNRFKDLFLSGNTIDLGGATIKTDATSGAIALIPQPTVANPNPTGIVVSPAGTVSTVSTTGGTLATNAISNSSNTATTTNTTTFGNITTSNVYADRFFYSNGTAFSSSNFGNTEVAGYFTSNVSGVAATTGALNVPVGTTAQRPTTTSNGAIRYNTTLGRIEGYMYAGGWQNILSDTYSVDYLIVGGGAGGGSSQPGSSGGGGGGAGGLLTGTGVVVTPNSTYAVAVGAGGDGGVAAAYPQGTGGNGTNSSALSYTAIGGGGGGGNGNPTAVGQSGGSGGGGGGSAGTNIAGGAGTAGQGNPGGATNTSNAPHYGSGGGGGAGAPGGGASNTTGGNGGAGLESSYSGTATYYAGGGGGATYNGGTAGTGGSGGGGNGGTGGGSTAGTTNRGGGGGGGSQGGAGSAGGSGIVIIRYLGSQRGTGGTVTSSGGYTIHTFTGSGSFTG